MGTFTMAEQRSSLSPIPQSPATPRGGGGGDKQWPYQRVSFSQIYSIVRKILLILHTQVAAPDVRHVTSLWWTGFLDVQPLAMFLGFVLHLRVTGRTCCKRVAN